MVIKKQKIKKFRGGGMDASKADFGASQSGGGRKDSYAGGKTSTLADYGYGPGVTKNPNSGQPGNFGNKSTNVTAPSGNTGFKINPVTTTMNIVGSLATKIPGIGYGFEVAKNVAKSIQKKTRTSNSIKLA